MAVSLSAELIALLEPLAESHGLELVAVETAGGTRALVVRVYLDCEGGIDIDTIARANEWVSAALEGVRALSGPYTLEVSSPGIDRIVRTRRDFERFAGRRVSVHVSRPIDGRARFTGVLAGVRGEDVLLLIEGTEHRVPLELIERARLKADLDLGGEGSGRRT